MKLKIFRYDEGTSDTSATSGTSHTPRYDVFEIEPKPAMTVLEALFQIQGTLDDSLAFRYSCRGAICGSCGMLINKVPRLACRTQIGALLEGKDEISLKAYAAIEINEPWDLEEEILIEPLPHMLVIKDLVVDMSTFFDYYRAVEPVFKPDGEAPERERLMDPEAVAELEKYTGCILCATCFGACPVDGENPDYLGPAALAKLYRFYIDPREVHDDSRLLLADKPSGWWACKFHANCKRVCPKGVPPNLAIGQARRRLQEIGKKP